jgi:C-terminal processing protease CtpA/Prc
VKYTLASEKPEAPAAPAPEEAAKEEEPEKPKDLKLSGEGKYLQVPDMVSPILQQYAPQVDLKQVNSELARYGVRWATDANGATLGLTADVASIPGAAALGFQPGDIIASVNGMPVNSEAQLLAIAGSVIASRGGGTISGTIIRNGQPVDVTLPIPKF